MPVLLEQVGLDHRTEIRRGHLVGDLLLPAAEGGSITAVPYAQAEGGVEQGGERTFLKLVSKRMIITRLRCAMAARTITGGIIPDPDRTGAPKPGIRFEGVLGHHEVQPTDQRRGIFELPITGQLNDVRHGAPVPDDRLTIDQGGPLRLLSLDRRQGIFDRHVVALDTV